MSIRGISLSLAAALAGIAVTATQAQAGFVAIIQQVGSNVVATGSGTLNTTALTNTANSSASAETWAAFDVFLLGGGSYAFFYPIAGPSSFGSGGQFFASSSTGGPVGI